ncbi:hypothetical protein V5799_010415 [Amblyomma americanum]|uniref:Uncharacterized protein n=1 Tax=Amblyomma americanum TaxID=6943 RepID=A0AAQ4EKR2_AMBAM
MFGSHEHEETQEFILGNKGGHHWTGVGRRENVVGRRCVRNSSQQGTYSKGILSGVLETIEIASASPNREIVQAALDFVPKLIAVFGAEEVSKHLQTLVPNLCCMSEDCRKHFQLELRDLFAELICKFGYENIVGLVPESYRKLAVRVRKLEQCKKRKEKTRELQVMQEDDVVSSAVPGKACVEGIEQILLSSSEDESEKVRDKSPGRRKTTAAADAWIEEQGDDIVDFLDTSAGKQILSTDTKSAPKSAGKCPFEITIDGRLLIVDPEPANAHKKGEPASDTEDAANNLPEALSHYKTKKRKMPQDADDGVETLGTGSGAGPSKKKRTEKASDGDAKRNLAP